MIVSNREFLDELISRIKSNSRIGSVAVDVNVGKVKDLFRTIGAISNCGRNDTNIEACDGKMYDFNEYELDNRLAPLATPRDVSISSSENSPSLRERAWSGDGKLTKSQKELLIIDRDEIGDSSKAKPLDFVRLGATCGDVISAANYDKSNVLTPGVFKEAQSILFSWFKSEVGSCTSMRELTKPVLLMDVIDRIDDGENTLSTILDSMSLPITLKCVRFLYKPYMYNYPLKEYYREFSANFIVNNLCVKPVNND